MCLSHIHGNMQLCYWIIYIIHLLTANVKQMFLLLKRASVSVSTLFTSRPQMLIKSFATHTTQKSILINDCFYMIYLPIIDANLCLATWKEMLGSLLV